MFLQSKKTIPWKKSDYVLTILQFFIHAAIILGLIVGIIFINGGTSGFTEYFSQTETVFKFVFVVMALVLLSAAIYLYFYFEFRDYLKRAKNIALIFVVLEISLIVCYVSGKFIGIYARPTAFCALLVLMLVNKRTAIFVNFCFTVLMFVIDQFTNQGIVGFEHCSALVIGMTTSVLAIYLVNDVGSRIRVFGRGFILSVPIILCALLVEFRTGMQFTEVLIYVLHGTMSGVLSVVYLMAILPLFEQVFNVLTNYRLAEITDHKSKLIKKLTEEAGGTFNHSLVVASLSETCAAAIGENPLLARAAAYYHDIGKIKQPLYFTENQQGYNPHDDLTPELSTEIIRSHTKDGYDLIKKYHLPLILADVAREHHGTLPIQFFYAKALKYTDGDLNIEDYSYPGPKPRTKIAAIIMLADGCEAAVRANADRSRSRVEIVVEAIVDDRMKRTQFSDCEITMREIEIIKQSLVNSLSGVYHDRIKYPNLQSHGNAFESKSNRKEKTAKNGKA